MSAWPFGHTSRSSSDSDINSILTNYFELLSKLDTGDNDTINEHNDNNNSDDDDDDDDDQNEILDELNNSFIEQILNQPDLLNELNRQNNTLLDFICFGYFFDKDKNKITHLHYLVDELISLISTPNDNEAVNNNNRDVDMDNNESDPEIQRELKEEKLNKATIISEIFALDIWIIIDELVKKETYLIKIWSLIYDQSFKDENSPVVTIFLKVMENLLFTKPEIFIEFILKQKNLVDDMLQHINIALYIDFFLKIIGTDKIDNSNGIIKFVSQQDLINKCLNYLNNDKFPHDIQNCIGDFLKALISISANAPIDDVSIGPNELTRKLASPDCIDKMINIILKQGGFALNVTVSIVIELIRKNNSDYDQINLLTMNLTNNYPHDRDPIYLGYLLSKFTQNLDNLIKLITNFDKPNDVKRLNQLNESFVPLGFERFKIVELIAELLHCSNMGLMNSKRAPRIALHRDEIRIKDSMSISESMSSLKLLDNDDDQIINSKTKSPSLNDNNDITSNDKTYNNNNNTNTNTKTNNNENYNSTKYNKDIIHNDNKDDGNIIDNNTSKNEINNDDENNKSTHKKMKSIKSNDQNIMNYDFFMDDGQDDEVDESFEIPYVNENQNVKLRTRPTIGDTFKITLFDNQILPTLLTLFLNYPWNNFWHNVIFDIIQQIFNGRMDFSYNSFLVYSLFDTLKSYQFIIEPNMKLNDCNDRSFQITNNFILKGYKNSYKFYETNKMNLGFMGHIVLIAEEIVKFSKLYKVELISPDIFDVLQEEDWKFYSEQVLNDTRLMYAKILGGGTYVDDGNGNIIPQFPDQTPMATQAAMNPTGSASSPDTQDNDMDSNEGISMTSGGLVNVEVLEEQLTTESDLHDKLREMLTSNAQEEIDKRNKDNGVIILGPPEEATTPPIPSSED